MKKILLVIFLIFGINLFAQDFNYMSKDTATGKPMLLGLCTRQAFQDSVFRWWYNSEYNMYDVDSTALAYEADKLKDVEITIVMGTWCSDSRREVPRFLKILDYLKYPKDKVKFIMVDRGIKGRNNETKGLKVEKVPTIIFYKNGKELGRIVEYPSETLDRDLVKIINRHQKYE